MRGLFDGSWSGMDPKPSCMRTCEADGHGKVPCAAGDPPDEQNRHYETCDDGDGHSKKFLCRCKLGWQGETCDSDVNECKDTAYAPGCTQTRTPDIDAHAYSLQQGYSICFHISNVG